MSNTSQEKEKLRNVLKIPGTIGSGTSHKVASMQQALGEPFVMSATKDPELPGAIEEVVRTLADSPFTQPLIALMKGSFIQDPTPFNTSCDVSMYSVSADGVFTPWHQPGSLKALKEQASKNFMRESSIYSKIYDQQLILVLSQLSLALISNFGQSAAQQGDLFIECKWFLMQPFTSEAELNAYVESYPQAARSNGGFLIQAQEIVSRIVAVSDEFGQHMIPATQKLLSGLKTLLLGAPSSPILIRNVLNRRISEKDGAVNLGNGSVTSTLITNLGLGKKFQKPKATMWTIHLAREAKKRQL